MGNSDHGTTYMRVGGDTQSLKLGCFLLRAAPSNQFSKPGSLKPTERDMDRS
jgi:hypothetical protein